MRPFLEDANPLLEASEPRLARALVEFLTHDPYNDLAQLKEHQFEAVTQEETSSETQLLV